tara:strand:- start:485 stop:3046 length:2562 start_codon:yes stop_codon:yes gene_type:complete
MAINKKPHFRGSDFNNQELKDAKSLQLNQDAVNADEAVRKSQSESIADTAAQDILITDPGSATGDTAFTSATMMGFLAGKQDNMEIDASSSAYLQIVDGYKIKATQLLITDVEVDEVYSTLASFISGTSPTKQQGDVVILAAATDNQERSWIKSSSASQNADGYVRLQTDYNVTSIRAMFNAGAYMDYSPSTGQFSVNLGTLSYELGAQTLPVDDSTFSSVSGNNMFDLAKSLESLILNGQTQATQATTTVDTRISSCTGVTGSNLGSFSGRFTNDSTIKDVLTETEQDLTSSETDRAAIRAEFASADNGLQSSINTEAYLRSVADSSEASSRIAGDNAANSRIDTTNLNLGNEEARALSAESALSSRLDTVEGGSSVNGSIAKAQVDAQAFATNAVNNEAGARQAADLVLQTQIDAIADAFQYKGNITTGVRIDHVDSTDSNHDKVFANASFSKGDMYKMNIGGTITFTDSTEINIFVGDSLVCINDATIGTATAADFHLWDNSESSDLLREGQLDTNHLERVSGVIGIVDDSIDRTKLAGTVEADIDSKLEKAGGTMNGALSIDKTVVGGTGYVGGYDFAAHIKQKSIDTDSLTDTQRALLVENEVYSNGSGNPLSLDYANATTSASHYKGASSDMSIATVGTHSEGSVASSSAAVYATGAYGVATSTQLGVNAGGTFIAQNAATSNLGVFAFSDTAGALNNRAGYLALAPDNVDIDAYRVARVASPLPVQDAVLVLDDYTGEKHALYANGKAEFAGKTIVQSASADNEAVNLGDIKAKEYYQTFTVNGDDSVVINHGLNSKKLIVQVWFNDEEITSSFDLEKSSDNSITIHNDSVGNLTGLEICIIKLSV